MPDYKVPVNDYLFLFNQVMDMQSKYQHVEGGDEASPDMLEAIFHEAATQEMERRHQSGDEGCTWNDGEVTTPAGFKEAYASYRSWLDIPDWRSGIWWPGLPASMSIAINEMITTANWAWAMYPGLSEGAAATLEASGTEQQKQITRVS